MGGLYQYQEEAERPSVSGRYKAIVVDRDSYLLELSRYIHLNPVRAGIVEKPKEYPYCSYRSYISKG